MFQNFTNDKISYFLSVTILIHISNLNTFAGLEDLLYILMKWATLHELLKEPLKAVHICLLLIQFGLGYYANDKI